MSEVFNVLIGIIILFFIFLIIKNNLLKKQKKFCVICTSIFLTWTILLVLYYSQIFNNKVIIALLIGESILGIYYTIESKAKKKLKIFRLPFLLTLILIGYALLEDFNNILSSTILLLILWIFFIIIYMYSSNKSINLFVNKLVECCKKW